MHNKWNNNTIQTTVNISWNEREIKTDNIINMRAYKRKRINFNFNKLEKQKLRLLFTHTILAARNILLVVRFNLINFIQFFQLWLVQNRTISLFLIFFFISFWKCFLYEYECTVHNLFYLQLFLHFVFLLLLLLY